MKPLDYQIVCVFVMMFCPAPLFGEPLSGCRPGAPAEEVSIINLIAHPGRFDGRRVEVRAWGIIDSNFSAGAIFPSKEDADYENAASGIHLFNAKTEESIEGFVKVVGCFSRSVPLFAGKIDVEKLLPLRAASRE